MPETNAPNDKSRSNAGIIGGYIGFFMALLGLWTTASEAEAVPWGEAGFTVLAFMIAGWTIGTVVGLLRKLLAES